MSGFTVPYKQVCDAPCKVNLTLDVFPPRADGFHDLDSIVARFSPADSMTISVMEGPAALPPVILSLKGADLPRDSRNLAKRAAEAFKERFPLPDSFRVFVRLEKRLPLEAGLGGGSSDAATVLRALAGFYGDAVTPDALREVAASLGSDVPLFLSDVAVRMQGRGDEITPCPFPLPKLYGVIVKPPVGVSTGQAYQLLDALAHREPGTASKRLLTVLADNPTPEIIGAALGNDFEQAVLPAYPDVAEAHQAVMDAGAVRTLLCGSGASVFGLARDRDHARDMTKTLVKGNFAFVRYAESL